MLPQLMHQCQRKSNLRPSRVVRSITILLRRIPKGRSNLRCQRQEMLVRQKMLVRQEMLVRQVAQHKTCPRRG